MKKQTGITLVVLIITVVVLLLLTGVTISAIKNDKIVNYAGNEIGKVEGEIGKKNNLLNKYGDFLNSNDGSSGSGGTSGNATEGSSGSGGTTDGSDSSTTTDNTLTDNDTHVHSYTYKVVKFAYLKSFATCTKPAEYYYSCSCGERGSSTFTSGGVISHSYNNKITTTIYLKTAATCTNVAEYYYSCSCGAKGTTTFTSGDLGGHVWGSWKKSCLHPFEERRECKNCDTPYETRELDTPTLCTNSGDTYYDADGGVIRINLIPYCKKYYLCSVCKAERYIQGNQCTPVARNPGSSVPNYYCSTCGNHLGYYNWAN